MTLTLNIAPLAALLAWGVVSFAAGFVARLVWDDGLTP
jgi:hypothetical protein